MNLIFRGLSLAALSLSSATSFASPAHLTTHNNTNVESNAYIAGTIPSPYPTAANSTRKIPWNMVKLACFGHTTNNKCPALIKMATNTGAPIDVAVVTMDLTTGDINPKQISGNGYTLTINGPGEATITKN